MVEISFVVIGYNVEKYIEKCITSIQSQTNKNIRIIFIDDGSIDSTREIVNNILKKDNRIRYVYQENSGANKARIKGLEFVDSEYVMFVDGDDFIDKDLADCSINILNETKCDFVVFNYAKYINEDKLIINDKYQVKEFCGEEYLYDILTENTPHYLWNKVFRMSFLEKCGFKNIPCITMGDDLAANVKFGLEMPKAIAIDKSLYYYLVNMDSVSRKVSPKHIEILEALEYIEKSIDEKLNNKYELLINFKYFRAFHMYVVRNSGKKNYIQEKIYDVWKSRGNQKLNIYIVNFMKNITIYERVLIRVYNRNLNLGYRISRLYVLFKNIKKLLFK